MSCATSIDSDALVIRTREGGAHPTVALFRKEDWIVAQIGLKFAQAFVRKNA